MAVTPVGAGIPRANPETVNSDSFRHSRRALLGVMAATPLVALPALAASPNTAAGVSPELAHLFAKHAAAEAVCMAYHEATEPKLAAYREAIDAIPHVTTQNSFTSVRGEAITLSTASNASIDMARRVLADIEAAKLSVRNDDYEATLRELLAAVDAREQERKRLAELHNSDAIVDESNRLDDLSASVSDEIIAFRSKSIHDLAAKAEFYRAEALGGEAWATPDLLADILQLGGRV